ncbi:MAG: RnfABCDGE type electron transport complex subunit D [Clostridia bacterium]|nr:RnfABCDGE type electron transport complex subunit D [Clostridia bacterium]
MSELLTVSPSPHIRSARRTSHIMLDVIIALIPALVAACVIFGPRSLLVVSVCVAAAMLSEWAFERITRRPNTLGDLSAVVTGMLLGLSLPFNMPLWQAVIGSAVAIIIVKQLFGGIGKNFANPAVTARIVILVAFSNSAPQWINPVDGVAGATPLERLGANQTASYLQLFLGEHGGSLGETCALALLLGGVYLVVRRVITWHVPIAYLGSAALLSWAFGMDPLYQLLSGGLMLGAIFMATDYSTSPCNPWGKIIFGVGCGLITMLIRAFGSYPEGVSFAILLMNILCPYIDRWTARKPFGGAVKA